MNSLQTRIFFCILIILSSQPSVDFIVFSFGVCMCVFRIVNIREEQSLIILKAILSIFTTEIKSKLSKRGICYHTSTLILTAF